MDRVGKTVLMDASPAVVPEAVREMLRDADGATPVFALPTGTRVDVGLWFRRRRVWVAGGGDRLVLGAPGPRPYVESLACRELRETMYNHVTQSLVFGPARPAAGGLRVPPAIGYALLAYVGAPPADASRCGGGLRVTDGQPTMEPGHAWKESTDA